MEPSNFKISVNILGDKFGSAFDDRVSVEFSPSDIRDMRVIFKDLALKENDDFNRQGWYREIHDRLDDAERAYRTARNEKDKE